MMCWSTICIMVGAGNVGTGRDGEATNFTQFMSKSITNSVKIIRVADLSKDNGQILLFER